MRLRTFSSLAAVLTLAAFAACTDSTAPSTQDASGNYSLQTVNANGLPYTYNSGSTTITIQSDTYTLNRDGTYSETINEIVSDGYNDSRTSDQEAGNWAQNGNAVLFAPSYSTQGNHTQYTGSLSGGGSFSSTSLTFSYNGVVWVYDRD
jgi:hypothetical protein